MYKENYSEEIKDRLFFLAFADMNHAISQLLTVLTIVFIIELL